MWQSEEALGNFIQRIPRDGAPATEVRVLYTKEALQRRLWDSEPGRIVERGGHPKHPVG